MSAVNSVGSSNAELGSNSAQQGASNPPSNAAPSTSTPIGAPGSLSPNVAASLSNNLLVMNQLQRALVEYLGTPSRTPNSSPRDPDSLVLVDLLAAAAARPGGEAWLRARFADLPQEISAGLLAAALGLNLKSLGTASPATGQWAAEIQSRLMRLWQEVTSELPDRKMISTLPNGSTPVVSGQAILIDVESEGQILPKTLVFGDQVFGPGSALSKVTLGTPGNTLSGLTPNAALQGLQLGQRVGYGWQSLDEKVWLRLSPLPQAASGDWSPQLRQALREASFGEARLSLALAVAALEGRVEPALLDEAAPRFAQVLQQTGWVDKAEALPTAAKVESLLRFWLAQPKSEGPPAETIAAWARNQEHPEAALALLKGLRPVAGESPLLTVNTRLSFVNQGNLSNALRVSFGNTRSTPEDDLLKELSTDSEVNKRAETQEVAFKRGSVLPPGSPLGKADPFTLADMARGNGPLSEVAKGHDIHVETARVLFQSLTSTLGAAEAIKGGDPITLFFFQQEMWHAVRVQPEGEESVPDKKRKQKLKGGFTASLQYIGEALLETEATVFLSEDAIDLDIRNRGMLANGVLPKEIPRLEHALKAMGLELRKWHYSRISPAQFAVKKIGVEPSSKGSAASDSGIDLKG